MANERPQVNLGNVEGSTFSIGDNSHAESHHHYGTDPRLDEATEQLLAAVRDLRADLTQRVPRTDQTAVLNAALAETEEEITTTGRAAPTRRQRLRELLADAQGLATFLTSAGTLAGLLGR